MTANIKFPEYNWNRQTWGIAGNPPLPCPIPIPNSISLIGDFQILLNPLPFPNLYDGSWHMKPFTTEKGSAVGSGFLDQPSVKLHLLDTAFTTEKGTVTITKCDKHKRIVGAIFLRCNIENLRISTKYINWGINMRRTPAINQWEFSFYWWIKRNILTKVSVISLTFPKGVYKPSAA